MTGEVAYVRRAPLKGFVLYHADGSIVAADPDELNLIRMCWNNDVFCQRVH